MSKKAFKPPPNADYLNAKVILLGAQSVGKTTIMAQQSGAYHTNFIKPTIGMEYTETTMHVTKLLSKKTLKPKSVDIYLKLKCFDTAGQERFKSIIDTYYRNVAAAVIVFDLTRVDSFADLKNWVDELKKRSKDDVVICILGNKLDLQCYRKIDRWTAEYFANSVGALYFETSAFRNTGIVEAFDAISQEIVQRGLGKPEGEAEEKTKKNCCKPM